MQVQICTLVLLTWDCITTLYAVSCLPGRISLTLHSDDEIVFFWQAEGRTRWSIARVLFMLVSFCTC